MSGEPERGRMLTKLLPIAVAKYHLVAFLMQLGLGIMAPVLPEVRSTFGVSTAEVALAVSAYGIARVILDLPIGILLDRVRTTYLFLAGTAVVALGGALGSQTPSFVLVVVARGLMGAGSVLCLAGAQLAVSRLSSPTNRGRLLGSYNAASLAGSSLSPAIGGAIAVAAGWRASFAFTTFAALLALAVLLLGKPAPPDAAGSTYSPGDEGQNREPVGRWSLSHRVLVTLAAVSVASFILHFYSGGFQDTMVPLIGATTLGFDAAALGLIIALCTLLRLCASLLGGELSDRHGRLVVLVPSLAILGLGVFGLNYGTGLATFLAAVIVMSLGRGGDAVLNTIIIDQGPARMWGRAIGINRLASDLGVAVGPLALGWLADGYGYGAAIYFTAGLVWLTALAALAAIREHPRRPAEGALG